MSKDQLALRHRCWPGWGDVAKLLLCARVHSRPVDRHIRQGTPKKGEDDVWLTQRVARAAASTTASLELVDRHRGHRCGKGNGNPRNHRLCAWVEKLQQRATPATKRAQEICEAIPTRIESPTSRVSWSECMWEPSAEF